jgi:hypothetical protein
LDFDLSLSVSRHLVHAALQQFGPPCVFIPGAIFEAVDFAALPFVVFVADLTAFAVLPEAFFTAAFFAATFLPPEIDASIWTLPEPVGL